MLDLGSKYSLRGMSIETSRRGVVAPLAVSPASDNPGAQFDLTVFLETMLVSISTVISFRQYFFVTVELSVGQPDCRINYCMSYRVCGSSMLALI